MINRILTVAIILVVIIAATAGFLLFTGTGSVNGGNGDDDGIDFEGGLMLDRVEIRQNGETHVVPAGLFHDQVDDLVLNEGFASLTLTFKADDGDEVEGREVILVDRDDDAEQPMILDEDGKGVFFLNFTLDGQAFRWNPYRLKVEDESRDIELLVTRANGPGDVTDTPNTPSELGDDDEDRPHTIDDDSSDDDGDGVLDDRDEHGDDGITVEIEPIFHEAIRRFCGFEVDEVGTVRLEENDQERFMVARVGLDFVQSEHKIAVGQPVWVMISDHGDRCYINPPCGNPEVPEGKLPPAPPGLQPPPARPPGEEVSPTPTRTNTPQPGSPTPPPANTPTRTSTSVPPTATNTSTPRAATQTPMPTFTPAPSGCPPQKPDCKNDGGFQFPTNTATATPQGGQNPQPRQTIPPPTETPPPPRDSGPTSTPVGGCGSLFC